MSAEALTAARRRDSTHRRRRVVKAINEALATGGEMTMSAIARAAGVHRGFLYRHPELHAAVLTAAAQPSTAAAGGAAVSRRSLLTDVANLQARNTRLAQHITTVERRLSEALGEAAWRESGLGAPHDIDTLNRRITELEQHAGELRRQLAERTDELDAARAANRELMTKLNRTPR